MVLPPKAKEGEDKAMENVENKEKRKEEKKENSTKI